MGEGGEQEWLRGGLTVDGAVWVCSVSFQKVSCGTMWAGWGTGEGSLKVERGCGLLWGWERRGEPPEWCWGTGVPLDVAGWFSTALGEEMTSAEVSPLS